MESIKKLWRVWSYTLGSFNDDTTHRYDDIICVLRTVILLSYLITNGVICAGVVRHWNDTQTKNNVAIDTEYVKK